jgi:acyl-CoA thioester hydrolase
MIQHTTQVRVRYGETDRMGYVYYGNHALYYEVGRVEMLRFMGYPYDEMERDGVMCPVTALEVRYVRPAFYDELLTVTTSIKEPPTQSIVFEVEIHNAQQKLVSTGKVVLAFVDATTRKRCPAPERIMKIFE